MLEKDLYTTAFFNGQSKNSRESALHVLPIVKDIVNPKSVVDVGCGVGTWLRVWEELGVEDVLGIDGSYIDRSLLHIEQKNFTARDLKTEFNLSRTFDLCMSLEVAEHLPESSADSFITTLTKLSKVILFSAAIPTQGGLNHVNEQWQDYWAAIFKKRGYIAIDCIRPKVWKNRNICFWYKQNIILYVAEQELSDRFLQLAQQYHSEFLTLVHPDQLLFKVKKHSWRPTY